jgi:hypothetical protein
MSTECLCNDSPEVQDPSRYMKNVLLCQQQRSLDLDLQVDHADLCFINYSSALKWLYVHQLRRITGLLSGHCHLKGHLSKLQSSVSPGCDRCRQTSQIATHILCHCQVSATLRFRHLSQHFMKPGDLQDISISRTLHFAQRARLLNALTQGLHKRLIMVEMHRSLHCLPFCIPF